MNPFDLIAPEWTTTAIHAHEFCCPRCRSTSREAEQVWLNRRSPVMSEEQRRKWQEFYLCQCGYVWWAWSNQRPPTDLCDGDRDPE